MSIAPLVIAMMMVTTLNPIAMATLLLAISIMTAIGIFKVVMSSWLALVTILTFSSGMMTLFMYTAAMSPNEKNKTKKSLVIPAIFLSLVTLSPKNSSEVEKSSMKLFSSATLIFMMIMIMLSMIAISYHGHHPNQTLATSF